MSVVLTSAPRLMDLGDWLHTLLAHVSGRSTFGSATRYAIDNNTAKRSLRGIAVERRNWLFAASMRLILCSAMQPRM
jgi:hypothetical protein